VTNTEKEDADEMERINIIGAGLAGLSAAITLSGQGYVCNLISMFPSERAQSVLAEGGINAALDTMGENDTVEEHFADTMKGGVYLSDPNAVEGMTSKAPETVKWLLRLGVPFNISDGKLVLRSFGGQKKKRTAYAKSSSGKIITSALIDEARKYECAGNIVRFPHHEVTRIVLDDDKKICKGVEMVDLYTDEKYFCPGQVILATGGMNGIFPEKTTGTVHNTGDLISSAFCDGIKLANIEFIQYHPTTVGIPGKRMLISEAARGEGGRLFVMRDGRRWYFMEELYPELGNLMPRDVISREMVKLGARGDCDKQVYLDMTGISKEVWDAKLSDLREEIIDYLHIDPAIGPVAVEPGIHFFMGGYRVNEDHSTDIEHLHAAGEAACQYHGANRLGGNSLLGAVYGGRVAALSAVAHPTGNSEEPRSIGRITDAERSAREVSALRTYELRDILLDGLGIIRDGESITRALSRIDALLTDDSLTEAERKRAMLGKAMLMAADARKESRGSHCRSDYPERDDERFRKTTVCEYKNGEITVQLADIPERRRKA